MELTNNILSLWQAGVQAVRGDVAVAHAIEDGLVPKPDRIIAVGKAAVAMAKPACEKWPDAPCLIVTKYDHAADAPTRATVLEAAHPVPDAASITAGRALQEAVADCGPGTHLLMLVSGGASALAEVPSEGLSLIDLMDSTNALLASGAAIAEMNAHRTARSQIKGGKLLAGFGGARVTTLALSDVEGDALATIGSGIADAPSDPHFAFHPHIVASNTIARDAVAESSALPVTANAETLYGDISDMVPRLCAQIHSAPSGVMILGGEPVVILPPTPGKGGRNMALALHLAREIAGTEGLHILVAGTDGTDGPTDAAGALVDGQTWDASGADALARADAYPWLEARGALIKSGPTGTNVADLLVAIKD
ncbi:glycerate kinase type-2 family protein [Tateyamaria sp.]|uniref:glycerate kinase type-2 family protein n=1 Tax=Tateyamaria sp. TaxID=1929288 RepID=UPI00329E0543